MINTIKSTLSLIETFQDVDSVKTNSTCDIWRILYLYLDGIDVCLMPAKLCLHIISPVQFVMLSVHLLGGLPLPLLTSTGEMRYRGKFVLAEND